MIQLDSKKEVRKLKIYKLMQGSNLHAVKKVRGKEAEKERGNQEIVSKAMKAMSLDVLRGCGLQLRL